MYICTYIYIYIYIIYIYILIASRLAPVPTASRGAATLNSPRVLSADKSVFAAAFMYAFVCVMPTDKY